MEQRKLNPVELDEVAADVRNFINTPAFKLVFEEMERQYVNQLKSSNVGSLQAGNAHASLRTIEELKAQLKNFSDKRIG